MRLEVGDKIYYLDYDNTLQAGTVVAFSLEKAPRVHNLSEQGEFYLSNHYTKTRESVIKYIEDDKLPHKTHFNDLKLSEPKIKRIFYRFRKDPLNGSWSKEVNDECSFKTTTTIDEVVQMLGITDKEPDTVKQDKMAELIASLKADAIKAGYRVGSTQLVNVVKKGVVTVLLKQGGSNDNIKAAAFFLDSDIGFAIISMMLGMGLPQLPEQYSSNPHVHNMAQEFQINGMATLGNSVMDEISGHLMPALNAIFAQLPAEEETTNVSRVRLSDIKASAEPEEEESAEVAPDKVAVAK